MVRFPIALCVLALAWASAAVSAPAGGDVSPAGRWLAEDIRGDVIDRLQTVLEISADGRVSGSGGCNRMAGRAAIAGATISFGSIVSTKMACSPAVMNQESRFFAALNDVRAWRFDPMRRKLTLLGADGTPLVVLARM